MSGKIALLLALAWMADAQSYTITTVAGGGPVTGQPATSYGIYDPRGVAVDAAGNLYLALGTWCQVWVVNPSGVLSQSSAMVRVGSQVMAVP